MDISCGKSLWYSITWPFADLRRTSPFIETLISKGEDSYSRNVSLGLLLLLLVGIGLAPELRIYQEWKTVLLFAYLAGIPIEFGMHRWGIWCLYPIKLFVIGFFIGNIMLNRPF